MYLKLILNIITCDPSNYTPDHPKCVLQIGWNPLFQWDSCFLPDGSPEFLFSEVFCLCFQVLARVVYYWDFLTTHFLVSGLILLRFSDNRINWFMKILTFSISHTKYKFESFVPTKLSSDNFRLHQLCDGLSLTDHQHHTGQPDLLDILSYVC